MKLLRYSLALFIVLHITSSSLSHPEAIFSPKDTIILSDLDGVLIKRDWNVIPSLLYNGLICSFSGLSQGKEYFSTLWEFVAQYRSNTCVSVDCKNLNDKINGMTFTMLYIGTINTIAYPNTFSTLMNILDSSHTFIDGTQKIYDYLKNKKGYTIDYATNKDRLSYDMAAVRLGEKFTDLPDKIFVAQPGNSKKLIEQLTESYEKGNRLPFLEYALTVEPSGNIYHAPSKKPCRDYYNYVHTIIGKNKNIVFIDDKQENINGFNALSTDKQKTAATYGITFNNPQQLASELVDLGILSEQDDQELLMEIRYPGIMGGIFLWGKKMWEHIFEPSSEYAPTQ